MRSTTKHLHHSRCDEDGVTQLVVRHCCGTRTHNILTRNPKHTSIESLDHYSSIVRKQNSVSTFVFLILLCLTICFLSFSESSPDSSASSSTLSKESLRTLPKLKILEYDETGAFIRNTLSIYPNSDLVLEDEFSEADHRLRGKKIVVECSATYPVQWSYSGDGSPDYVENSLVNENHFDNDVGKSTTLFSTSLSFRRTLQEQDTGKYTCTNVIKENVASSVYLFVAGSGKKLFAYASGATKNKIKFSRNEATVRIPCSVTHPNVLVSLHKFQRTFARRFLNDSSISYNPKSGFHLDLSKIRSSHADPSGIYICSAALNNAFQFIEYELTQDSPVSTVGELNGSTTDGSCSFKYDCSSDTTCFMNKCRSPCSIYPVTCPRTSRCQVINHSPSCVPIPTISNAEKGISDISSLRTEFEPEPLLRSACGPTVCGRNAECIVIEYKSHCVCLEGYTGNGKISCHRMSQQLVVSRDPCSNARCGLHSSCTEINGHAVCSCLPDYNGYPPYCKPEAECSSNKDCSEDLFCNIRISKCQEPCLSFEHNGCGSNAICVARKHNAYCLCNEGYTGNPNSKCFPVRNDGSLPIRSPCHPSPCGQSAHCRVIKDKAPYCYCPSGLRGNPRIRCYAPSEKLMSSTTTPTTTVRTTTFRPFPSALDSSSSEEKSPSPCETHPCGPNAACRVINGVSACKCYPDHTGDPYRRGCFKGSKPRPQEESSRPAHPGEFDTPSTTEGSAENASVENHRGECRVNGNCPLNLACYNYRCVNPCLGSCGRRARCKVVGHTPVCSCPELFHGDPLISCRKVISNSGSNDPCTACGPNSNCKIINRRVHCDCNPWSVGTPPKCRRVETECSSHEDCADNKACVENKCLNPCEYSVNTGYAYRNQTACGFRATCDVVNHKVSCRCPPGFNGDPITSCYETGFPANSFDPCGRAPCGPNSQCKVVLGLVNYRRCTCNEGYYFSYYGCRKIPFDGEDNPCNYSPCGPNSLCSSAHGVAYCQCDDKSTGTPPHCYPKISTFNDRWTFVPIISE